MSRKSHSLIPEHSPSYETLATRTVPDPSLLEPELVSSRHGKIAQLRIVWNRRRFLLRAVAIGLVASFLIAYLIPSRYTSSARLMPPDDQSTSGLAMAAAAISGRAGLGSIGTDILGMKSTSDIFVGILGSRTTKDKIIRQFGLEKVYHVHNLQDARKVLEDRTTVSVDRKSQIIEIDVTDTNPQRAAGMGRAYIEELNNLVADLSTSSARRERIFLEQRIGTVKKELENAEASFSQFASKNVALDVPAQARATLEAAAVLQGQLIAAQSELEGLRQIYSDNNVRVRSASARVAELQVQLQKIGGKTDSPASSNDDSLSPSIRRLPLLGVTYADLYRETKIEETVFETLTQQYELAKVQEAKEIPTVKVLDSPDVPEKKSYPSRLLIVLLATAIIFCLGIAWVLTEQLWQSVNPNDPGKMFAQEIAETIKDSVRWKSSNGSGGGTVGKKQSHTEVESKD